MIFKKTDKYLLMKGDVLECMSDIPSNSVDCIFTSPPYNIGLGKRKDTNIATYDSWEDNMSWEDYCEWQIRILDECYRILKEDGVLFYQHKDKFKNEEFGSGTTGVAALLLNHKYIGIDISEKYLTSSARRLDNYMLEANRAQREIDLHYVKSPYVAKKVTNQITFFDM